MRGSAAAAAVVAVARSTAPPMPGPADVARVVRALRHHGLAPLGCLVSREGAPELSDVLTGDLQHAVARHMLVRSVMPEVDAAMAAAGQPWAVLKGPVLSEMAHPVPGVRPYVDLDLLVAPGGLRATLEAFHAGGWTLLDGHHPLMAELMPGEVHLGNAAGVLIDLHWSVLNSARLREVFPVRTEPLLERRRPIAIGDVPVPTLDPADLLLHTCLHAALTRSDRFVRLVDVHGLVSRHLTDPDGLVSRAQEWGAGPATSLMLTRAAERLGTPVPPGLATALADSRLWPVLVRAAEHLSPAARLHEQGSLSRIVARSSRPTAGASERELLRRAVARLGGSSPSPASILEDRPDPRSLDRYLEDVASGSGG